METRCNSQAGECPCNRHCYLHAMHIEISHRRFMGYRSHAYVHIIKVFELGLGIYLAT